MFTVVHYQLSTYRCRRSPPARAVGSQNHDAAPCYLRQQQLPIVVAQDIDRVVFSSRLFEDRLRLDYIAETAVWLESAEAAS